jgi:hypothetical protein
MLPNNNKGDYVSVVTDIVRPAWWRHWRGSSLTRSSVPARSNPRNVATARQTAVSSRTLYWTLFLLRLSPHLLDRYVPCTLGRNHCMLNFVRAGNSVVTMWSCHGSGGQAPSSHRGVPVSVPGQSVWELYWTNWHGGRFFPMYIDFSLSVSLHKCPIHTSPTL